MQDLNKPAGAPEDFRFVTPEEREMRALKNQALAAAEQEFQQEQALLKRRHEANEAERKRIQAAVEKPANMVYLIVGKKPRENGAPTFSVVGMYSSFDILASHLIDATEKYHKAGQNVGVVEFDLSILQNQPAVDPK